MSSTCPSTLTMKTWVSANYSSDKIPCFQLPCLIMHLWRLCTSSLTQQPLITLKGTRRWNSNNINVNIMNVHLYICNISGIEMSVVLRWLLRPSWVWLEALWVFSLASPYWVESKSSSTFSGPFVALARALNHFFEIPRCFASLKAPRTAVVSAVHKKYENHLASSH